MSHHDVEAMRRRLEELEKENARLRGQKIIKKDQIHAVVGDFKGHPVLKFEGPFKPFTLGLRKSWIVLQMLPEMQAFVDRYKDQLASAADVD
jgi:hypothetical protein